MVLIKQIEPSWSFDAPITSLVKVASSGVTYADKIGLRKRASEDFTDKVHKFLKPRKGEEYVHVIALGCNEFYGPNRKGDAFSEDVCARYYDTFEKYARWYRDHIHHNPAKSYGVVKIAHYDRSKKRIDLLVALNATEEGVKKNGGLIADKELEKLANNEILPVSMSCIVSYDICSGCGHKAKNIYERCTPKQCVKYGGCATNLGKTFDDGHTLHVLNPDPVFFDISYVQVPADRIAFSLGIVREPNISLQKVSHSTNLNTFYKSHAELKKKADNTYRSQLVDKNLLNLLRGLVRAEDFIRSKGLYDIAFCKSATYSGIRAKVIDPIGFINTLYDRKQLIHPADFYSIVYPSLHNKAVNPNIDVRSCFFDLYKQANLDDLLLTNPYFSFCYGPVNFNDVEIINALEPYSSLESTRLVKRAMDAYNCYSIGREIKNTNSIRDPELSKEYALFLLSGICRGAYNSEQVLKANQAWYLELR